MRRIFIDSGFIIALVNQRDKYHQQALGLADKIENYPLLITDTILLEIGNALFHSYRQQAIEIIEYYLNADEVEVVNLNLLLFRKALRLYKIYQEKEWDMVNCISFVVMQEAGIEQVLTFDKHFRQAGFQPLV